MPRAETGTGAQSDITIPGYPQCVHTLGCCECAFETISVGQVSVCLIKNRFHERGQHVLVFITNIVTVIEHVAEEDNCVWPERYGC